MRKSLLTAATATNSAPSAATDGVSLRSADPGSSESWMAADSAMLLVYSTAGAGQSVTIKLWGYDGPSGGWFPLGAGTDSGKGVINDGSAMGETSADTVRHSEYVVGLSAFSRLYAEVTAIGGTATAVSCDIIAAD